MLPIAPDLLARMVEHGMRIVPVMELTAFMLASVTRTNSYLDPGGAEHALWWDRISHDDELQCRQTLAALTGRHNDVVFRPERDGLGLGARPRVIFYAPVARQRQVCK